MLKLIIGEKPQESHGEDSILCQEEIDALMRKLSEQPGYLKVLNGGSSEKLISIAYKRDLLTKV